MTRTRALHLSFAALALFIATGLARADTYRVRLEASARTEPATGRVVLFFIKEVGGNPRETRPIRAAPVEGPFFERPQPIASIAVKDFKGGDVVTVDGASLAWPETLDKLDGQFRVQAILDADLTVSSHRDGPGNVFSEIVEVELSGARDDTIEMTLAHRVPQAARNDTENLKWVELRSEMLSKFYGRDVYHRAGVALPKGWGNPKYPRQSWPAIYVVPGFGGRDEDAIDYADMLLVNGIEDVAPVAVHIVLDPDAPLGHHGFVDSPNNGPRGEALMKEFIPFLETKFHLIAKPEARIVTGHSSGAWSSLWLQLMHPETFGACWSRAPDPVDFSCFQMTDLYSDKNIFTMADGGETPSYRGRHSSDEMSVLMTVRQESGMERAIDSDGRSGQQWDAWEAMFSPRDDKTGLPRPLFDDRSGAIHADVVESWKKYDIARLIENEWNKYGPIMLQRVRLAVGDEDSYYLERAVRTLHERIEALQKAHNASDGDGYVLIVPEANHNTIADMTFIRWNEEMRAYLKKHDMLDPGPPRATRPH